MVALFVATGLSIWAAVIARSRRSAPGSPAFAWLMLIVAEWCLTTALHALVVEHDAKVTIVEFGDFEWVVGEILEPCDGVEPDQTAELVVARRAALTIAERTAEPAG